MQIHTFVDDAFARQCSRAIPHSHALPSRFLPLYPLRFMRSYTWPVGLYKFREVSRSREFKLSVTVQSQPRRIEKSEREAVAKDEVEQMISGSSI